MLKFLSLSFLFLTLWPVVMANAAPTETFLSWRDGFYNRALDAGVSESTLKQALLAIEKPNEKIMALDQKQPEKKLTFAEYINRVVSQERVATGSARMENYADALKKVTKKYGVPQRFIVSLWGVETHYGKITGGFSVVEALASMAYEGRRREFFEQELISALKILDQGHITLPAFTGSWAGAMGQCQFMPSSFERFAVDGNGDGHRDIWTDQDDIFSSIANYLKQNGWNPSQTWGRSVRLPENFDPAWNTLDAKKTLTEWKKLGVKTHSGNDLSGAGGTQASLIIMDDDPKQAFLVYDNFRVLLKWNKSRYFALSVGLLSDAI